MRTFAIILLSIATILLAESAHAVGSDDIKQLTHQSYEMKLEDGIEAFYRSDWQKAARLFRELRQEAPQDARSYFFESMIPFWKYYFGGNSEQAADRFLQRSQKAIEISQNQLEKNPRDTTMVLMLSGLYGYQSLVAASEKRYKTAIQSGMTGFKYTRQLLSLDADDPKALIGKGMFYYMVGSVPSGLQWVTNLAGISGDMQEGFDALEQAAQSDSYVSNDAKMILAYLYEREKKYQQSLDQLKDLTQRYPENIIFQYNQARLLEQCQQPARARQKYQHVLTMEVDDLQILKEKSRNRLKKL
ncbi:MAG: hypothetical protein U5J63_12625 [Fodinibius sp.]|nr:hypothetical protein [Fodinibius sp.]